MKIKKFNYPSYNIEVLDFGKILLKQDEESVTLFKKSENSSFMKYITFTSEDFENKLCEIFDVSANKELNDVRKK